MNDAKRNDYKSLLEEFLMKINILGIKHKDITLASKMGYSLILGSLNCLEKKQRYEELIVLAEMVTMLFEKVNEIDFPLTEEDVIEVLNMAEKEKGR